MKTKTRSAVWGLAICAPFVLGTALVAACSDDDATIPVSKIDAGTDAGHDAGHDASLTDAADVPDTGTDTTEDASVDASEPADATADAATTAFCVRHPEVAGYFDAIYLNFYNNVVAGNDCRSYNFYNNLFAEDPNNQGAAGFLRWKEQEFRPWYNSFLGCPEVDVDGGKLSDGGAAPRTAFAVVPYATPALVVTKPDYELLAAGFVQSATGQGGSSVFTSAEITELQAMLTALEDSAVTNAAATTYTYATDDYACFSDGGSPAALRAPRTH